MIITKNEIKNLKDKSYRKQHNLFLVEGEKFCRDLRNSDTEILKTIASDDKFSDFPNFELVSKKSIDSIATTKTPQDIICICRAKIYPIQSIGNSLILDTVQDPGNVGTLIRSALAFGFDDVYLIDCADVFSEKVIRSSVGTVLISRVHNVSRSELIQNRDKIAKNFVVADMIGVPIDKIHLPKGKFAVIIGNEGQGVGNDLAKLSEIKVSIPMTDKVESLNAGVAGSIIMQKLSEV